MPSYNGSFVLNKSGVRKRCPNWEEDEKVLLKHVIQKYVNAIESKGGTTAANHARKSAWLEITKSYNCLSKRQRDAQNLKKCWQSMKKQSRKSEDPEMTLKVRDIKDEKESTGCNSDDDTLQSAAHSRAMSHSHGRHPCDETHDDACIYKGIRKITLLSSPLKELSILQSVKQEYGRTIVTLDKCSQTDIDIGEMERFLRLKKLQNEIDNMQELHNVMIDNAKLENQQLKMSLKAANSKEQERRRRSSKISTGMFKENRF